MTRSLFILLFALLLMPAALAQDFYEQQLRAGKVDAQAGRNVQAADEFRIAAFGFLDRPPLLVEALVRLAVAQSALSQTTELAKTLDRFIEVEQRFAPYGTLVIEPALKSRFEELIMRGIPRATLAAIPDLSRLANAELQRIAALPQGQRIAAYEAGARREPKNPEWPLALAREAAARDETGEVVRWAGRTMEIDPANREARLLLIHARTERGECREALALLNDLGTTEIQRRPELGADQFVCLIAGSKWAEAQAILPRIPDHLRSRPDVNRAIQTLVRSAPGDAAEVGRRLVQAGRYQEAVERLQSAVQSDPQNRQLRLALLEAAVLNKDFRTAAAQLTAVTPLNSGEELYMFYASVAMYETGRKEEAKVLMQRARPRMESSPLVDYYINAVLGGRS